MIAALYVAKGGCYFGLDGVDPWDEERDARLYAGPWPVVAHPPCQRWGKFWSGGPSAKVKRKLGDDGECFANALIKVRRYGGVIEHPAYSKAWEQYGLPIPSHKGGWNQNSCHVEQGHYGHRARKATWLYAVGTDFPELVWGPSEAKAYLCEPGIRSPEHGRALRASPGYIPVERLTASERIGTPTQFRDLLISMAESVNRSTNQRSSK